MAREGFYASSEASDRVGSSRRIVLALALAAGSAASAPAAAGQTAYQYDARGRLVGVNRTGTGGYGAAYSYDRADNRLSYAVTAAGSGGGTPPPPPPPVATRGFAVVPLNGFRVIPLGQ